MDADKRLPDSPDALSPRATGALDLSFWTPPESSSPARSNLVSRDLLVRIVEQIIFVTAVIGAVAMGLGISDYFREHRYVAAYLLAYIGFRFADLLVGDDPNRQTPPLSGFSERVLNELPILIVFAAAPFERTYFLGGEAPAWLGALGLLLELAGLWLALGSRIQLHFLSSDQSGRERMVLVKTGFFRYIRHPVYAGVLLVLFAWPLEYGAPVVAILTMIIGGVVARRQITADEKVLLARFGEEFEEYCSTSDALIPSIW
ncbi:MAG: methyltransferase family protein [Candidatus Binataceae bacterium]